MLFDSMLPGTKTRTSAKISDDVTLPVWLIKGAKEGRRLTVTAGVHGCEYIGIEAVRRFYDHLDPASVCGNILLIPVANPGGFYGCVKQLVPSAGRNLNRAFPGEADGDDAGRIAYFIETEVYPGTDLLIDMHSGDIHEELTPLLFYPVAAGKRVRELTLDAALHMPIPYRVPSTAKNGLYSWGTQKGIPGMIIEIGCRGERRDEQIALAESCLTSAAAYLGICGGTPMTYPQRECLEPSYITAGHDGFWYPRVHAGQLFTSGQLLGQLTDIEGRILEEIRAPYDGVVMYNASVLGVCRGGDLFAIGRLE